MTRIFVSRLEEGISSVANNVSQKLIETFVKIHIASESIIPSMVRPSVHSEKWILKINNEN